VLYTILAVVFTCCIGGIPFFAFLGIGESDTTLEGLLPTSTQYSMSSSLPASLPSPP
jgi:hypothetical protein